MKKKILLLIASCAVLMMAGCKKDNGGSDQPNPGPDPGPTPPEPTTEITVDNAAPTGFTDEGISSWD